MTLVDGGGLLWAIASLYTFGVSSRRSYWLFRRTLLGSVVVGAWCAAWVPVTWIFWIANSRDTQKRWRVLKEQEALRTSAVSPQHES